MALLQPDESLSGLVQEAADSESLGHWLVRKWCYGKLSAHDLVEGAKAALVANRSLDDYMVQKLATISEHNAHRDIVRFLQRHRPGSSPPIYMARIPLWKSDLNKSVLTEVPFCLPHEWLHFLAEGTDLKSWTRHPPEYEQKLREWEARTRSCVQTTPLVAMSIWGDTAPFHSGQDSVLLLLWSSACENRGQRRWITLLTKSSLCQCGCGGLHTLDAVWAVIRWSLVALVVAKYPRLDHEGHPLEQQWRQDRAGSPLHLRAAVLQFRGDWPWLSYVFQLNTHANTKACFLCEGALDLTCPLTDAGSTALWRGTCLSSSTWLENRLASGSYISQVFSWPGFHFGSIVLDWMHMVDLGCAQQCLGNILFELFKAMDGRIGDPGQVLGRLHTYLGDVAHSLGVQVPFTKLTLTMIRGEDMKPRLKLKAARTRAMVPLVYGLLETHFPPTGDRELRRFKCLGFLLEAYNELEHWGESSAQRLTRACQAHVLLYLSLSREALRNEGAPNWVSWRWFPKHHMLLHLSAEQAQTWGNPRTWWCYSDEGSIGIAVQVAETAHPLTLPKASFQKYLVHVLLETSGL